MKLNWINSPPINQAFVQKGMSGERERESSPWYLHGLAQPQNFSFCRSCLGLKLYLFNFLTRFQILLVMLGFPGGASGKELTCQCRRHRDLGSIPGLVRSPGGEHGNLLQGSCLENPMDRGAWRAMVDRVAKSHIRPN